MQVSEITISDIKELKDIQPDGWPDITEHFIFYIDSSFCRPVKFSIDKKIVGIGCSILHKSTSWLAHIIVHKDFRNRGIGTIITKTLVERLDKNKFQTISLIATQIGEPVYKKIGFKKESEYHFFKNENLNGFNNENENIKDNASEFNTEILDIDKKASGEDRSLLLKSHLSNAKVFIYRHTILGFYLPTLGEGLVVATDEIAGIELSKARFKKGHISVLPQENESAISFLIENNFKLYQKGTRMSVGRKPDFKPKMLFNRIGGNIG